jgi:DUF4097 and DUF4098 domain-containing protein YvlB
MKIKIWVTFFVIVTFFQAYSEGKMEAVNIQEIDLDNIQNINVLYNQWENAAVYNSPTEQFIIKEYMNRNNRDDYAKTTISENTLTLENGNRPFTPLINTFSARLEVYIPRSYKNTITVKTRHGKIEIPGKFICTNITIENSSGNILIDVIDAETIDLKTTSGNITINEVNSLLNAETRSGRIRLNMVKGTVTAKTRSGGIVCAAGEDAGNLVLETSSGGITLSLPRTLEFNFSARTSGALSTPFSGSLSRSEVDKHLAEGIIGEAPDRIIQVKAGFGETIKIKWIE